MTIRKHLARILHKAARKLDPPRSLSDLARDQNRNAPQCKLGPEGVLNTGYTDPAELVRFGRDALAEMQVNSFRLDRWTPSDQIQSDAWEVARHIAEKIEAERRKDK